MKAEAEIFRLDAEVEQMEKEKEKADEKLARLKAEAARIRLEAEAKDKEKADKESACLTAEAERVRLEAVAEMVRLKAEELSEEEQATDGATAMGKNVATTVLHHLVMAGSPCLLSESSRVQRE